MNRWMKGALALLAPLLLTAAVQAAEPPEVPASGPWTRTELAGAMDPAAPAWPEDAAEGAKAVPENEEISAEETKDPPEGGEAPGKGAKKPAEPVFPEAEDWQLLLVNPWNPLPEDFRETLALKSLPNGLHPLVCSAYRTQATQTRLHNNKIARLLAAGYPEEEAAAEAARWVAAPGTSEHQTGLAVDIVAASYQILDEGQAETAEQKWLMEHCWEYGFILRYPSEKEALTGVGYEPWHYRYVGRPAALDIRDSGLCLEEYLERRAARQAADASVPLPAADASAPLPAADAPAG